MLAHPWCIFSLQCASLRNFLYWFKKLRPKKTAISGKFLTHVHERSNLWQWCMESHQICNNCFPGEFWYSGERKMIIKTYCSSFAWWAYYFRSMISSHFIVTADNVRSLSESIQCTWCALWVKVLPEGNHRPCIGRGIWLLVLSQGLQRVGLISTNLVSSSWLVYHISRLSTSGHYVSYIKLSRLFKGQRKICLFWFKSINMVILILCCVKTQS